MVAAYIASDGSNQQETVTVNTGESRAEGVDLEMNWIAARGLRIDGSLNYIHHVYLSGSIPDLVDVVPGPATQLSQYRVTFSPNWKGHSSANYDLPWAPLNRWTVHVDGDYQGTAETDVYNTQDTQMQSRLIINGSLTYHDPNGKWTFTPWINNATDKIYRVAALPVAGLWNFTNYGPPRSFGLTANFKFE